MAFTLPSQQEAAQKQKEEEVGFFESALAGVATGLWNIPKGLVSLGAEIYDLAADTDTAKDVEQWFDDVNPWDDEAEARTVGKITQALTQIGIPAVQGYKIGASLASRALQAKKAGKYLSLGKIGSKIMTPTTGGLIGGGVGEALVADEDIGTFADITKGTALEPYALTMLDRETKEGREEAFRRLKNRLKFGTEGALFNLALIGVGKTIQQLRKPTEEGLDQFSKNSIVRGFQKFGPEGGLSAKGLGTKEAFESKEFFEGLKKAAAFEASETTKQLDNSLKDLKSTFYDEYLNLRKTSKTNPVGQFETSGQEILRKEIQEILSPASKESKRLLKDEAKKRATDKLKLAKNFEDLERSYLSGSGNLQQQINKIKKTYIDDSIKVARDEYVEVQKKLLGREPTVQEIKQFKKEAANQIKKTDVEIKALGNRAIADIELLDIDKQIQKLGRPATKQELAAIEKNAFNELEKQIKKLQQEGAFKLDDYQVTDKFKELLDIVKKNGGDADKLKDAVLRMRTSLDNLSSKTFLKDLTKETSETVLENFGRYSTSVYRQIEQKGLFGLNKSAPVLEEIERGKAKYVDLKLKEKRLEYINKQIQQLGRRATPEEYAKFEVQAIRNTEGLEKTIAEEATKEVDKFAKAIANDEVAPTALKESDVSSGELKTVRVDTSVLEPKILNQWQEEVFGVIKDPSYTYFSTSGKLANLNYTLDYLNQIAKQGSGANGFIKSVTELDQINPNLKNDPNKWRKFENPTDIPTPLDGLYIQAPKYESIMGVTSNWLNKSGVGTFYKYAVLAPKAASQITKTILSPLTHVRNLISAGAFVSANGAFFPNYGDIKLLMPKALGGEAIYKQAYSLTGKRVFGTLTKADQELYERLLKVGVVDSQVQAGEMKRLLRDIITDPASVDRKIYDQLPKSVLNKSKKQLTSIYEKLQDAYVAEDDFWKIINWNLERNRYSGIVNKLGITKDNVLDVIDGKVVTGIDPKASNFIRKMAPRTDYIKSGLNSKQIYENFLDEIAGNLTRNQVPNYSYIGRTAKALRQTPFGNFIAFPLEIMRTGNNIFTQAIDEITSGIPELATLGYRRLFSFGATVGGVPYAMVEMFKAKNNVTDEEMNALRKFVPEWSKNSTLLPTGRDEDGYLKYIDFSYSNPYDYLVRPARTILNEIADGNDTNASLKASLGRGITDSFGELLEPFASESIFTEALIDTTLRKGIGRNGKRVWSETDDFGTKITNAVKHIGESLAPGSIPQFRRLGQAVTGKSDKYGRTFKLEDELPGLYGFRSVQSNPEEGLTYMTTRFVKELKNSNNSFTAPLLRGGRVSKDDVLERYQYSESRRFHTMKEMYKNIDAARKLGVSENVIRNKVKRRGIAKEDFNDLLQGVYTPNRPNKFFINRMNEITRNLNEKEGVSLPNPYFEALPTINDIINENRRINLLNGELKFPDIEISQTQVQAQSQLQIPQLPSLPSLPQPIPGNQFGQIPQQINPATGLTSTETALLSPSEQLIRQKQRGIT